MGRWPGACNASAASCWCRPSMGPWTSSSRTSRGVTYAEKIAPEDRLLDPSRPAIELERVVRALHPHIGARLKREDGSFLGVQRAHALSAGADAGAVPSPGSLAGEAGRLLYGTADGALELTCVQPPGGRPMDSAAYLRGHGASSRA